MVESLSRMTHMEGSALAEAAVMMKAKIALRNQTGALKEEVSAKQFMVEWGVRRSWPRNEASVRPNCRVDLCAAGILTGRDAVLRGPANDRKRGSKPFVGANVEGRSSRQGGTARRPYPVSGNPKS